MTNIANDIDKLTNGVVKISAYTAQKLAAANSQTTVQTVFAGLKTSFAGIQVGTVVSTNDLVGGIFKVLSAGANLSQNLTIQAIENVAQDIYASFNGGSLDGFLTLWPEIEGLFQGKVTGTTTAVAPINIVADETLLEQGFATILAFALQQAKQNNVTTTIEEVIAGITAGLNAIDQTVALTEADFTTGLYDTLEAIADFTQNSTVENIEALFEKVWGIVTGGGSGFVNFFKTLVVGIQIKKALKAAASAKAA